MLPKLWISAMLTLLLLFMTYNLATKARQASRKETAAAAAAQQQQQQHHQLDEEAGATAEAGLQAEAAGAAAGAAAGQTGERLLVPEPDRRQNGSGGAAAWGSAPRAVNGGSSGAAGGTMQLQLAALEARGGRCSAPCAATEAEAKQQLDLVLKADGALYSPVHLALLALMTAWVIGIGVLKSVLPCGSWQQWLVVVSMLLPACFVLGFMRCRLLRAAAIKARSRHVSAAAGGQLLAGTGLVRSRSKLRALLCSCCLPGSPAPASPL
jgi:hypothetical protein